MYAVHCTMYIVRYTMYGKQCTVYSVRYIVCREGDGYTSGYSTSVYCVMNFTDYQKQFRNNNNRFIFILLLRGVRTIYMLYQVTP